VTRLPDLEPFMDFGRMIGAVEPGHKTFKGIGGMIRRPGPPIIPPFPLQDISLREMAG